MPPTTTRGYAFTPLSTLENLQEGSGDEEREDDTSRQPTGLQSFCRALYWAVCSATTIYSTKQLMTTHGFHYPLTIAFRAFSSILVVYAILIRLSVDSSNTPEGKRSRWTLRKPDRNELLFHKNSLMMMPASLTAAVSLPMLLEGLLHMPSLPVIVMLFPIVYATESLVLSICCPSRVRVLPWDTILVVAASAVVLYNEYRLMVQGLVWGVTGVLFIGVSRAFFVIGSERVGSDFAIQARLRAYHSFVIMTLVLGMIVSAVLMACFEMAQFSHFFSRKTIAYICFNMACFIGTAFSGTSLFSYFPISFEDLKPQSSPIPIRDLEFLFSFASSLLVLLASMYSHPVIISWMQLLAYLTAAAFLVNPQHIHSLILEYVDSQSPPHKPVPSSRSNPLSRILTSIALYAAIIFCSWALSSLSTASINARPASLPSKLDTLYRPSTRFEIVISMYDESPEDVKAMLSAIKATTFLSTINPHITLYTKNPSHSYENAFEELKAQTGADQVKALDNLGREGGTYLHHIVSNWDSIAEQTLFIQAHAHNLRELIPRINSYLVPESGFLSLGFAGVSCFCGDCNDRWGWEDKEGMVGKLYERIYEVPCEKETPILLTYKGQLVASARRLRGIPRSIYSELLETITGQNSTETGLRGAGEGSRGGVVGNDTPDNPYFGFTVERIWGLLGQCATDQRIAVKCPSLLSGMGSGGEAGDCGCLDTTA